MGEIQRIDAAQLQCCRQDATFCVIDVRSHAEYAMGSVAACCWPVDEINAESAAEFVRTQQIDSAQTLVLVCARGLRSRQAAEKLRSLLPNPLMVVEGGHAARVTGRKVISIERQVRIAAGGLILLGVLGSVLIHPAMIALSAVVGAGLVFAGMTDWCGMGLLLLKMPWNK